MFITQHTLRYGRRPRYAIRIVAALIVLGAFADSLLAGRPAAWLLVLAALSVLAYSVWAWAVEPRRYPEHLQLLRAESPEAQYHVCVGADGVTVTHPTEPANRILWSDVARAGVVTAACGPGATDFWWVLEGPHGSVQVPLGANGMEALEAELQRLPGWDSEIYLQAIRSTSNASFTCWVRQNTANA